MKEVLPPPRPASQKGATIELACLGANINTLAVIRTKLSKLFPELDLKVKAIQQIDTLKVILRYSSSKRARLHIWSLILFLLDLQKRECLSQLDFDDRM